MAQNSSIEWTDATWNATRGCTRVSEGCRNCYAEVMAARFSKSAEEVAFAWINDPANAKKTLPNFVDQWGHGFAEMKGGDHRWTGKVALIEEQLTLPLRWKKPRRVFVNSTSDLFHEALPDAQIDRIFAVMALSPQHTFQILTKRPERMRQYLNGKPYPEPPMRGDNTRRHRIYGELAGKASLPPVAGGFGVANGIVAQRMDALFNGGWPLPNVWLGTSVEDQATADERIPHLLQTPAVVRFVSYEPALDVVDFGDYLTGHEDHGVDLDREVGSKVGACIAWTPPLDWIIVGGESGPNARPFQWRWADNVVRQCRDADVACFVKQYGSNPVGGMGDRIPLRDRKGGDWLEWPEELRVRQFPDDVSARMVA